MDVNRQSEIELLAGKGKLIELKHLLGKEFSQLEIDIALGNAVAYSQIETAEYLLSLGADFSNYDFDGVYYAIHNNEIDGLKYAISKGVDVNVRNGMPLNKAIHASIYSKNYDIVSWLVNHGADTKLLSKDSHDLIDRYWPHEQKVLLKKVP